VKNNERLKEILSFARYQRIGNDLYRQCDGCLSYELLEKLTNWDGPLYCRACMKLEERREEE
jgi:hypothetical protein